ncbi:sensor histidine kinase [Herbidospora mongoliensis]|uniref:sensor histidine kinase n=1 Tax=Herbidospora mongoliensis TaxID=688067 RepID=UPI000B04AB67|nr:sensor histidine kinase [Herbidospora mongoliensis]
MPFLLVAVVPFTLLAGLTGYLAAAGYPAADLWLCAVAAAWMLGLYRWREKPVFFAGLLVIAAVMVLRNPVFGLFTPVPYIYAFTMLRWPWRLAGVGLTAVVSGLAQASPVPGLLLPLVIVGVNVVMMGTTAWVLHTADLEREQRIEAVARLEAALEENAGLHAQLLVQAREAGVLDERQRMAREIHDTLAQGLTGIITQLQAAEQLHEVPQQWRRPFDAVKGLARESLQEARRSVDALRPAHLETARLSEALASVADRWSALQGIPVEVTTTGTVRSLDAATEFGLLRTAQEALANVAKHAGARRVGVTLSYLEGEVALDVRDDGKGFDLSRHSEGFGLSIMRQRVEGLSGSLRVESEPGLGTGISACVPWRSA